MDGHRSKIWKKPQGFAVEAFTTRSATSRASSWRRSNAMKRIKQLSNPDPRRAIEGFLETLVTQMGEPSRPRGCLHTNTSLEFPNAPDEVLRIIAERTAGIEGAIYVVLRRAQAEGLLDPAADARAVARFYVGVAKGITVLHKVFGDASALRDIVKIAMSKWPYPEGKWAGAGKRDLRSRTSLLD